MAIYVCYLEAFDGDPARAPRPRDRAAVLKKRCTTTFSFARYHLTTRRYKKIDAKKRCNQFFRTCQCVFYYSKRHGEADIAIDVRSFANGIQKRGKMPRICG